jgi:hypothetical protein
VWRPAGFAPAIVGLALASAYLAAPSAADSKPAAPSDFNGDGYADLAIGVPFEYVGQATWAGAVNVIYGGKAGLSVPGNQMWTQDSPGVKGVAEGGRLDDGSTRDQFGRYLASGDFDADGYADLAIAVPSDRVAGEPFAGSVNVLYGSRSGLIAAGDQLLSRANLPIDASDVSGGPVASGDFDADGYSDLVICAGEASDRGLLVVPGSATGLDPAGATTFPAERIGAVTAGDLNGDGYDDIAAGEPEVNAFAGAVRVLYGSAAGIASAGGQTWTEDSSGVGDQSAFGDAFGDSVAIGDFDADGYGDLGIGAPGDVVVGCVDTDCGGAGSVVVLYGSGAGLSSSGAERWTEDSPGVPSRAGYLEQFGKSVAAGDFDGDGADELAAGVPREAPGGAAIVLHGGAGGLSSADADLWSQDTPGVPGHRETPDRFGRALTVGNFGHSFREDLAIGVPFEKLSGERYAGTVNVLYGSLDGLSGTYAQGWSQAKPGITGAPELGDRFGYALP